LSILPHAWHAMQKQHTLKLTVYGHCIHHSLTFSLKFAIKSNQLTLVIKSLAGNALVYYFIP
jgi:hypothetical protein